MKNKITNPLQYASKWDKLSSKEQQRLINKWQKDTQRNKELRDVLKGILKERSSRGRE